MSQNQPPSLEAVLVRLELMDKRNDERHEELVKRIDSGHGDHEERLRDVEAWQHTQDGRGSATWPVYLALIGLAVETVWRHVTGIFK